MRSDACFAVILVTCSYWCSMASAADIRHRDRRTIDFVIRGLADTFGYDVQKRPSVVTALKTAPVALPPAPRSTLFPPPVAPLPKGVAGPPALSIRLFGARQAVAPAAAPVPAAKPSKPMPALPAPRKNPPVTPAAVPRPLLRENIMKTFNVAFNFNRDVNTVAPPTPAPDVPPAPPRRGPAKPPPTPATKNTLRPPPPPKPTPTKAPPSPPLQTLPPVATPPTPRKPQLYQNDYDDSAEYSDKQNIELDAYEEVEPVSYDYKNLLRDGSHEEKRSPTSSFEDSREQFKQSLDTFWAGSPHLQNSGYKYLAENISDDEDAHSSFSSLENPRRKYEEYDIPNEDYQKTSHPRKQKQQKFILYKSDNTPENEEDPRSSEEAEESKEQAQKLYYRVRHEDESNKKDQVVNKIIKDFQTFERQRKNLPPEPDDRSTPIKLREKQRQERERQNQRAKQAIRKQIDKGRGFVEPAYTGVIRAPLQEAGWSIPFDVDNAATNVENHFRRIQREAAESDEYKSFYEPERYEIEGDYKEPEPTVYNYSKYEKLHEHDDATLSANAKIENKQYGQRIVRLKANNDTSSY